MAKKDKAAEGDEEAPKKKKPVKLILIVVLGLVGVKMFVLKEPAKTPEQIKAAEKLAEQELYNTCAEANGMDTLGDLVDGGKDPAGESSTETTEHKNASAATGSGFTYTLIAARTSLVASGAAAAGPEGPIVPNEASVTVNLQDGHYLKLGLAIQLPAGADAKLAKEEGLLAKATDMSLKALAVHDMKELYSQKVRSKIQNELSFDMCRDTEAGILKVYFTEFVMQ